MKPPFLTLDMQSVMCVPIYRNQTIEGVLVFGFQREKCISSVPIKNCTSVYVLILLLSVEKQIMYEKLLPKVKFVS